MCLPVHRKGADSSTVPAVLAGGDAIALL
jgi:hypothetical protein